MYNTDVYRENKTCILNIKAVLSHKCLSFTIRKEYSLCVKEYAKCQNVYNIKINIIVPSKKF